MVANIICIKWGTLFGPEYVNRLFSGVRRNLSVPVRFFCMTENSDGFHPDIEVLPLPVEPYQDQMNAALAVANRQGAMRKTSLFRNGLVPIWTAVPGFRSGCGDHRSARPAVRAGAGQCRDAP